MVCIAVISVSRICQTLLPNVGFYVLLSAAFSACVSFILASQPQVIVCQTSLSGDRKADVSSLSLLRVLLLLLQLTLDSMICLAWLMSLAAFMCVVNVALCVCVCANVKCNNNNNKKAVL